MSKVAAIVEKLIKSKRVVELVDAVKPLDIAKAFVELGLTPHDASRAAIGLVKATTEDFAHPRVQNFDQYPTPPPKDPETVLPNESVGNYTSMGHGDLDDFEKVPPKPIGEPSDWPYDAMTVQGTKPEVKANMAPVNASFNRQIDPTQKNPGIGGTGAYQKKSPHNISGRDWSHNPQNRDHELPDMDFLKRES